MSTLRHLSFDEILNAWSQHQKSADLAAQRAGFLSFYSSVWGGVSRDSRSFFVPIDDHGFHRGDGVFEAIRSVSGKPYLMTEHLERVERSSAAIGLTPPMSLDEIAATLTAMAADLKDEKDLILRLFITRGPGGFGVNPKDSPSSRLYAVATRFKPATDETWLKGVRVGLSKVLVKAAPFPNIKSLNYLPNVMMKKEAVEAGFDFGVGFDKDGFITEGATENLVIIDKDGNLSHPELHSILHGCTMKRLFDLVEQKKILPTNRKAKLTEKDLREAKEILLVGTALDVTPVSYFVDEKREVGPMAKTLRDLIRADQAM